MSLSAALIDEPKPGPVPGTENPAAAETVGLAGDHAARRTSDDGIYLGLCPRFETIVVRTCRSTYELIVLQGDVGDVLVRGGRRFPAFRRVQFDGSKAGENTIGLGLGMRFHVGDRIVVTSPVQAVSRHNVAPDSMESETAPWRDTAAVPRAH